MSVSVACYVSSNKDRIPCNFSIYSGYCVESENLHLSAVSTLLYLEYINIYFFVHIVLSTRVKCHLQVMYSSDKVIDIGLDVDRCSSCHL